MNPDLQKFVAALYRQQPSISDSDIAAAVADYEKQQGAAPTAPTAAAEARPGAVAWQKFGSTVGNIAKSIVMPAWESAGMMLGGPMGTATAKERLLGTAQTAANVASFVPGGGIPGLLAKGALVGATYNPDHPVVGAATGAVGAGIFHGVGSGVAAGWNKIMAPAVDPAVERASSLILKRLGAGKRTLPDVEAAIQEARALGKPTHFIDVGGQSVANLGRDATAYETAGTTELTDAVTRRMDDAPERILGDLAKTAGISRQGSLDAIDALATARETYATPAYDKVRDVVVRNPQFAKLMAAGPVQSAYKKVQEVAANHAAAGKGTLLPDLDLANPEMTVGTLDRVKRSVDDMIFWGKRPPSEGGGMGQAEMNSLKDLRNALVEIGDDATRGPNGVSLYKLARGQYEGPTKLMEMVEEAKTAFLNPKTDHAMVKRTLAGATTWERDAYKLGALDAVSAKFKNMNGGDAARQLKSTNMKEKIQLLFDSPTDYADWEKLFLHEKSYGPMANRVVAGSRTAPMLIGAGEVASEPDKVLSAAAVSAVTGNPGWLAGAVARRLGAIYHGVRTQSNADAIGRMLATDVADQTRTDLLLKALRDAQSSGKKVPPKVITGLLTVLGAQKGSGLLRP